MSERNPVSELPLFASASRHSVDAPPRTADRWGIVRDADGTVAKNDPEQIVATRRWTEPYTPREHGEAGGLDAERHLRETMPGWLLAKLGDALLAQQGRRFTSDQVRAAAGPTVDAWLTDANWPERRNCFSGWFTARAKAFHLKRLGSEPSTREDARGRWLSVWEFPLP